MKMRRLLSALLVLSLVLTILPIMAFAATVDSGEWGQDGSDVTWSLDSNGKLTISGTGKMTDCYLVSNTSAGEDWFRGWDSHMDDIKSVVIENGISYIGEYSFQGAQNLKSVTIANSVKEIGRSAFANCDSLTSISFGTGLTKTGIEVFYGCDGLETLSLPNVDVAYGDTVFGKCTRLKNITIPAKQTTIAEAMFEGCTSITSITIPNTVKVIEGSAFHGCTKLKSITLPNSITEIGYQTFQSCDALTSITIPDSVTVIDDYAFESCGSLKSITLPANLKEMGSDVFAYCNVLTSVTVPAKVSRMRHTFESAYGIETIRFMGHAPVCGSNLFSGITATVYYPSNFDSWTEEFRQDYGGTITWKSFVSDADPGEIRATGSCGENVSWTLKYDGTLIISGTGPMEGYSTQPDWYDFKDKVKAVEIQKGVTTIGNGAFYEHDALEKVSIANTVTTIGSSSFFRCYALKKVQIPDSVQEIYARAFAQCTGLTEVVMGNGVTTIDEGVFQECTSLSKVTLSENLSQAERNLFSQCTALTEIQIPASLTEIPSEMFSFSGLKKIVIPDAVTSIGSSAFYECSALSEIHFDGLVPPSIDGSSFSGVTATAYYPDTDAWTEDMLQDYGGTLTWVSYHVHNFDDAVAVFDAETKTHSWACVGCGEPKTESCTFESVILEEATLDEYGVCRYTCTVCGGSYEQQVMYRISGDNRAATALAAADELKEILGVDSFDTIIIASGTNFADALAGSYLAAETGAPILLYTNNYEDELADYVSENLTDSGKVYILGGTYSVPETVENALLDQGFEADRLAGDSRFETNLAILEEAGVSGEEILVCTAYNFADSLSASAVGQPILLVNKNLTADQKEFLSGSTSFAIIGGVNSVSEDVEAELKTLGDVIRVSGDSREETSAALAQRYFTAPDYAVLAYSRNFPDGLCGGPLAYALGAPLLLTNSGAEAAAAEYVAEKGITKGVILGGPNSVSDATANLVFSIN